MVRLLAIISFSLTYTVVIVIAVAFAAVAAATATVVTFGVLVVGGLVDFFTISKYFVLLYPNKSKSGP